LRPRISRAQRREPRQLFRSNRLCAELLRLSHPSGQDRIIISPPPTHLEIALRIGTRREAVTKSLNALEREGVIARNRGAIALVAPERLRQIAGGLIDEVDAGTGCECDDGAVRPPRRLIALSDRALAKKAVISEPDGSSLKRTNGADWRSSGSGESVVFRLLQLSEGLGTFHEPAAAAAQRRFDPFAKPSANQGVSDNGWSSLRAAPKLPSW
jgi:hypothetical protein